MRVKQTESQRLVRTSMHWFQATTYLMQGLLHRLTCIPGVILLLQPESLREEQHILVHFAAIPATCVDYMWAALESLQRQRKLHIRVSKGLIKARCSFQVVMKGQ